MTNDGNGWIGKMIAGILSLMLLGFAAPAASATESADEACAAELRAVRSYIEAEQATLSFPDAAAYLLANAPSCDLQHPGAVAAEDGDAKLWTQDDAGSASFTDVLTFACGAEDGCSEGESSSSGSSTESEVVGCLVGGAGPGTVTGQILGIQLLEEPGAGTWEPQNGVIEVTGEGATVGGTQIEELGEIRILKSVPLPANEGSTSATCLKTIKTTTDITRRCIAVWFFVWIVYCEEKIHTETEVVIEPCTGSATQILSLPLAIDRVDAVDADSESNTRVSSEIVRIEHAYAEDPNPCESAKALAAFFS